MIKPQKLTLLLATKDNQIILAMKKRGFGQGKWNGVGGKVEPGETIEEAMIRESQEEINITPRIYEHVATHNFRFETGRNLIVYAYISTDWSGSPEETDEMAPKWFNFSDIPYDHMWADDKIWLPLVLNKKKLLTTFKFDAKNQLLDSEVEIVKNLPVPEP